MVEIYIFAALIVYAVTALGYIIDADRLDVYSMVSGILAALMIGATWVISIPVIILSCRKDDNR